jgi:pimeloyl-ACP methyl ester carboxylesterase
MCLAKDIRILFILLLYFRMHVGFKPIVLIPGFGGSKLIDNCPIPPPAVRKPPGQFIPFGSSLRTAIEPPIRNNDFINLNLFDNEWEDKFLLRYDRNAGLSIDDHIDVHDFGGVDGVRNLCNDCDKIDGFFNHFFKVEVINKVYNYKYYDTLITRLEEKGYVASVDLFGAPYDFRKIMIPEYFEEYLRKLRNLIETSYDINKKPCTLVAHSIGCLVTYIFLVEYSDALWKKKYIEKFISIGGPYGGSSIALKTLLSGLPKLNLLKEKYSNVIQNSTGLIMALPNVLGYDTRDPIVYDMEKIKSYNIQNVFELLPEIPFRIWHDYIKYYLPCYLENNEVNTVILTTTNVSTDIAYLYESIDIKTMKEPERIVRSHGDGVIPKKSLLLHSRRIFDFPNYKFLNVRDNEHTRILHSKELFDIVIQ